MIIYQQGGLPVAEKVKGAVQKVNLEAKDAQELEEHVLREIRRVMK